MFTRPFYPFEMTDIEPGENPTQDRVLTWKSLDFLSHIKSRTNEDRLSLSLWEVWFSSILGVPIPALFGPPQPCSCNTFHYDSYVTRVTVWRSSADMTN